MNEYFEEMLNELMGEESIRLENRVLMVGAGQMGAPFIPLMLDTIGGESISVIDPSEDARRKVTDTFPDIATHSSLSQLEDNSFGADDWVLLAVKPNLIGKIADEVNRVGSQALIISIAVGVSLEQLEALFPFARIIRLMPNLAMLIGEGTALLAAGDRATQDDILHVGYMLEAGNEIFEIEESQIDVATAISGSGPAYCALVIDALKKAGAAEGLNERLAHDLACSTMAGTAMLLEALDHEPRELADAVQSPGGTTERAVAVLEERGLEPMFRDAVHAAVERAKELKNDA